MACLITADPIRSNTGIVNGGAFGLFLRGLSIRECFVATSMHLIIVSLCECICSFIYLYLCVYVCIVNFL